MKSILLIEDEPILGETMVDILELYDYRVHWKKSLEEFLAFDPKKEVVHLICCDFHLPDGSLRDVHAKLKASETLSKVPLLVISATASEHDIDYINKNIDHFLMKPFKMSSLLDKISALVSCWVTP